MGDTFLATPVALSSTAQVDYGQFIHDPFPPGIDAEIAATEEWQEHVKAQMHWYPRRDTKRAELGTLGGYLQKGDVLLAEILFPGSLSIVPTLNASSSRLYQIMVSLVQFVAAVFATQTIQHNGEARPLPETIRYPGGISLPHSDAYVQSLYPDGTTCVPAAERIVFVCRNNGFSAKDAVEAVFAMRNGRLTNDEKILQSQHYGPIVNMEQLVSTLVLYSGTSRAAVRRIERITGEEHGDRINEATIRAFLSEKKNGLLALLEPWSDPVEACARFENSGSGIYFNSSTVPFASFSPRYTLQNQIVVANIGTTPTYFVCFPDEDSVHKLPSDFRAPAAIVFPTRMNTVAAVERPILPIDTIDPRTKDVMAALAGLDVRDLIFDRDDIISDYRREQRVRESQKALQDKIRGARDKEGDEATSAANLNDTYNAMSPFGPNIPERIAAWHRVDDHSRSIEEHAASCKAFYEDTMRVFLANWFADPDVQDRVGARRSNAELAAANAIRE